MSAISVGLAMELRDTILLLKSDFQLRNLLGSRGVVLAQRLPLAVVDQLIILLRNIDLLYDIH